MGYEVTEEEYYVRVLEAESPEVHMQLWLGFSWEEVDPMGHHYLKKKKKLRERERL